MLNDKKKATGIVTEREQAKQAHKVHKKRPRRSQQNEQFTTVHLL